MKRHTVSQLVLTFLGVNAVGVNSVIPPYESNCGCDYNTVTLFQATGNDSSFMQYMENELRKQCNLKDTTACHATSQGKETVYDFIVVGAGSGGSVTASRLSENRNWYVVLLEAGGPEPVGTQVPSTFTDFEQTAIDWNFFMEPGTGCFNAPGGRCRMPRGKVMGGTSILNNMVYSRGNPWDFDEWERLGNRGWSFKDVIGYFLKSEDNRDLPPSFDPANNTFHNRGGLLTVERFPYAPQLARQFMDGIGDLGEPNYIVITDGIEKGFALSQATNRDGARLSTSKAFIQPFVDRPNLKIFQHARVTKILITRDTKMAIGVEYIQNGEIRRLYARREVIISAGAVMSPFLLLHSGIGPAEQLEKFRIPVIQDLSGVGKRLMNHWYYEVPITVGHPARRILNKHNLHEYLETRKGPLASTGFNQFTGFERLDGPLPEHRGHYVPDLQFFGAYFEANYSKTGEVGEVYGPNEMVSISPSLLVPNIFGEIRLKSKSPLVYPLINGTHHLDSRDINLLIKGIRFIERLVDTPALRNTAKIVPYTVRGCEGYTFGSYEFWECAIRRDITPEHHWTGTCKMGPRSDRFAVVDDELKVHGIADLRVIDASIMPTNPHGNTNAIIVMIGEKGADMIKHAWPASRRPRQLSEMQTLFD